MNPDNSATRIPHALTVYVQIFTEVKVEVPPDTPNPEEWAAAHVAENLALTKYLTGASVDIAVVDLAPTLVH